MQVVLKGEWTVEVDYMAQALSILADIEEAAAKRNCEMVDSSAEPEEEGE